MNLYLTNNCHKSHSSFHVAFNRSIRWCQQYVISTLDGWKIGKLQFFNCSSNVFFFFLRYVCDCVCTCLCIFFFFMSVDGLLIWCQLLELFFTQFLLLEGDQTSNPNPSINLDMQNIMTLDQEWNALGYHQRKLKLPVEHGTRSRWQVLQSGFACI